MSGLCGLLFKKFRLSTVRNGKRFQAWHMLDFCSLRKKQLEVFKTLINLKWCSVLAAVKALAFKLVNNWNLI